MRRLKIEFYFTFQKLYDLNYLFNLFVLIRNQMIWLYLSLCCLFLDVMIGIRQFSTTNLTNFDWIYVLKWGENEIYVFSLLFSQIRVSKMLELVITFRRFLGFWRSCLLLQQLTICFYYLIPTVLFVRWECLSSKISSNSLFTLALINYVFYFISYLTVVVCHLGFLTSC